MSDNTRAATAATPLAAPPKRELYAVAIEVLHKASGAWRPAIVHTHAPDAAAAKFAVLSGVDWKTESVRVVGVSRALGFHVVSDKKRLILSA